MFKNFISEAGEL